MKQIAHRGLVTNKKEENTIKSFLQAIKSPDYVGFECDVRTSKDGIFVIHHDLFIEGNLVRFLTYQELKKYHLPKLEDVLKLKTNKIKLIEVKEANLNIDEFANLIKKYPQNNVYIMSFDNQVIQKLKKKELKVKLGVLNYVLNSENSYEEYDFIGILSGVMSEELYEYFTANNIEIMIYGILNKKKLGFYENVYYIVDAKKKT
ncbi:MAG: glycerophosphodiester phosphodiesterase [Bacilli bacterium]|nr:glycerophosphodiester phosphodiesterase [Bacilli bacterium]